MTPHYQAIVERLYQIFTTCPDPNKREHEAGWSIKQIVGHLIDSVNNNHQRLARYVAQGNLIFPGYDQNTFVQRMHYDTFDFLRIVTLWYHYNQLFLHVIDRIPQADRQASTITIGDRAPLTLEQLISDYFAHMEKHERQVQRIICA